MKKLYIFLFIASLFINSCTVQEKANRYIETKYFEKENEKVIREAKKNTITQEILEEKKIISQVIPEKGYIEADFICQAPLQTEANWVFHEESCEEAALLQTLNFEKKIKMTKNEANEEILKMIKWQMENFAGHNDLYADKLKEFAIKFYGLKDSEIKIIYDATLDDIKRIISSGHPIIAPVTSKYLKNPNYPYPGYHMLQIKGFNTEKIITNDNGTRKGKDYSYSNENFIKALNDAGGDIIYLDIKKEDIK